MNTISPRWISLAALVALSGCKKDDDSEPGACNGPVRETFPDDGASDMCFASDIEFTIDGISPTATIALVDAGGTDVPGTTTADSTGTIFSFHPDAPLAPNTAYTATFTDCDGNETTVSFTTDAYGEPLTVDPATLVGKIFAVDLKNDSRFHKPPGVSNVLQPMLDRIIWLEVLDASTTSISLRLGVAADGSDTVQDMCTPTVDFTNGTLDGPTFEVGPADIQIPVGDVLVELQGVIASGTFVTDGSTFGCGGFNGDLDTRPVAPLIKEGASEDYVCVLVGGYGAQCLACDDGVPLCMELEVDQAGATPAKGVKIVPVTEAEVANNPKCGG